MQVPSFDVDTAMSLVLELCPSEMAVIAVRCADNDLRGESGTLGSFLLREGIENDKRSNRAHTWMLES